MDEIREQSSRILFSFCRKECPEKVRFKLKKIKKITKEDISQTISKLKKRIKNSEIKAVFVGEKVVISCNV